MPTVNVAKNLLFEKLGQTLSDEELDVLCFQFGIELDDIVEEGGVTIYKIDIPANRYDLLCVEGLCRALRIFQGKEKPPIFNVDEKPDESLTMHVDESVKNVRPFVVTAVLRNLTIDAAMYESIIALQEKLHGSLCRRRSLVAIGMHDLDALTPPFFYAAVEKEKFSFAPLGEKAERSGLAIIEKYLKNPQMKAYAALISHFSHVPLIKDSQGIVLSLPPLINGDKSRLSTKTTNVYIEATATDLTKAHVVLDVLVAAFNCNSKVETTIVNYWDGRREIWPKLQTRQMEISTKEANQVLGLNLDSQQLSCLLAKMGIKELGTNADSVVVEIPAWRHDILHAVDVYEDAAISFGYDQIPISSTLTSTVAFQNPTNKLTEKLRENIAMAGFTEALTFALCGEEDEERRLLKSGKELNLVRVKNPKAAEFTAARCSLLSGLLKTAGGNKSVALPLRLFEISDVVWNNKNSDDAENRRHFAAINYNKRADMQIIHGLVDRFFQLLNVPTSQYKLKHATHLSWLLPGRAAGIYYNDVEVGWVGEIHPDVLTNFDLSFPVAALEIHIGPFV